MRTTTDSSPVGICAIHDAGRVAFSVTVPVEVVIVAVGDRDSSVGLSTPMPATAAPPIGGRRRRKAGDVTAKPPVLPSGGRTGGVTASKAALELYRDRRGEHRWRLVHDNGHVIADSGEGYRSKAKARKGLESVKRNAPDAPVVDAER